MRRTRWCEVVLDVVLVPPCIPILRWDQSWASMILSLRLKPTSPFDKLVLCIETKFIECAKHVRSLNLKHTAPKRVQY